MDASAPKRPPRSTTSRPSLAAPASRRPAAREETEDRAVECLLLKLLNPAQREETLCVLNKRRKDVEDQLALLLWNSFGVMTVLLQEIITVYSYISPPTLSSAQSNRLSDVLALVQCVASHPETAGHLIDANIPIYLYPILSTTCKEKPFDFARLACLGVLGALAKLDSAAINVYLLKSEIVPLCIHSMEHGSELSRTVATYIIEKLIRDDIGLNYICQNSDRLFSLGFALGTMVNHLIVQPSLSLKLLKHIIPCYVRLSEDLRGAMGLKHCFPDALQNGLLCRRLNNDPTIQGPIKQLLHNMTMATLYTDSQMALNPMIRNIG